MLLVLELSLSNPLHKDIIKTLGIMWGKKTGSTWGKSSFRGLKSDKISKRKAEDDNLINRLHRTCSAEA